MHKSVIGEELHRPRSPVNATDPSVVRFPSGPFENAWWPAYQEAIRDSNDGLATGRIEHAVRAIEARQNDEANPCKERERVAMEQALNVLAVLKTISSYSDETDQSIAG
jgi:hypothetical protein